jgi:hypothetical protein
MQYKWTIGGLIVLLLAQTQSAIADDSSETNPQPLRCEDSQITKMGNYFENVPDSGFYVMFASKLGVEKFPDTFASVVDRNAGSDAAIAKQQVGDKVQVCLIGTPAKDQYCNPDQDSRGRFYRVYNYRLQDAYTGTNGNHLCGGA